MVKFSQKSGFNLNLQRALAIKKNHSPAQKNENASWPKKSIPGKAALKDREYRK